MKITFLLPVLDLSGGNRVVATYASMLCQLGHSVTVVIARPKPIPWRARLLAGSWRRQVAPSLEEMRSKSHFAGLQVSLRLAAVPGGIQTSDVPDGDVVIATWWETAEWAMSLSSNKGIPISFVQGHEVFDYLPVERARATYRLPIHRITISRWLLDILRNQYGVEADLIPNAVDHKVFYAKLRSKQQRPTVGLLFTHSLTKGVAVAARALLRLAQEFPDLRIVSFGSGAEEKFLGLDSLIEFTRRPSQEHIREIYSSCDVWLSASTSEGFNLPSLEAMACGAPVVATRTGWPLESIVDGQNGFLIDIGDEDAMVSRVGQILRLSPREWQRMSSNALSCASRYTWDESVKLFEHSLIRACSNATSP